MRRSLGAMCVAVLVTVLSVACGSQPPIQVQSTPLPMTPIPVPSGTMEPTPAPEPSRQASPLVDAGAPAFAAFDPTQFTNGATIDNPWLPLERGRRWVLEGVTIEGEERIPHRITFTVTDLTKVIADVETAVVWIEDISAGALVEKEIAFYAQDDHGTVWYLGEHPEEYEDGEFVVAPTWMAGFQNARAGVKMFAEPMVGMQTYYQGWGPLVEWSDYGQIDATGLEDCVVTGCYSDVVRFAESSLGEDGIYQLKSYARGVGEIRVGWRGDAETREELELVSSELLDGAALAEVRRLALELEQHAYEISPDLYGQTDPAG